MLASYTIIFQKMYADALRFLANRTKVTVELLAWLSSVTDVLWLNGARQSLGCYCSQIESRILAFKLPANHRPWMTLKVSTAVSTATGTL